MIRNRSTTDERWIILNFNLYFKILWCCSIQKLSFYFEITKVLKFRRWEGIFWKWKKRKRRQGFVMKYIFICDTLNNGQTVGQRNVCYQVYIIMNFRKNSFNNINFEIKWCGSLIRKCSDHFNFISSQFFSLRDSNFSWCIIHTHQIIRIT